LVTEGIVKVEQLAGRRKWSTESFGKVLGWKKVNGNLTKTWLVKQKRQ